MCTGTDKNTLLVKRTYTPQSLIYTQQHVLITFTYTTLILTKHYSLKSLIKINQYRKLVYTYTYEGSIKKTEIQL